MIILPPSAIGQGYRQLQLDEPIRSTDQWFSVIHEGLRHYPWRPSMYWSSDLKVHDGKVPYRRAVSLGARIAAFWRLGQKVWVHVIRPRWTKLTAGRAKDVS